MKKTLLNFFLLLALITASLVFFTQNVKADQPCEVKQLMPSYSSPQECAQNCKPELLCSGYKKYSIVTQCENNTAYCHIQCYNDDKCEYCGEPGICNGFQGYYYGSSPYPSQFYASGNDRKGHSVDKYCKWDYSVPNWSIYWFGEVVKIVYCYPFNNPPKPECPSILTIPTIQRWYKGDPHCLYGLCDSNKPASPTNPWRNVYDTTQPLTKCCPYSQGYFLMPALEPCPANPACNGVGYNPELNKCCKNTTLVSLAEECCGSQGYDPAVKYCCADGLTGDGRYLINTGQRCCKGTGYDPTTHQCCGIPDNQWIVYPIDKVCPKDKCGPLNYDSTTQKCCSDGPTASPNYVIPNSQDCCGGTGYSPTTQICCADASPKYACNNDQQCNSGQCLEESPGPSPTSESTPPPPPPPPSSPTPGTTPSPTPETSPTPTSTPPTPTPTPSLTPSPGATPTPTPSPSPCPNCCNGASYDPQTQGCCKSEIKEEVYDKKTQGCCNGTVYEKSLKHCCAQPKTLTITPLPTPIISPNPSPSPTSVPSPTPNPKQKDWLCDNSLCCLRDGKCGNEDPEWKPCMVCERKNNSDVWKPKPDANFEILGTKIDIAKALPEVARPPFLWIGKFYVDDKDYLKKWEDKAPYKVESLALPEDAYIIKATIAYKCTKPDIKLFELTRNSFKEEKFFERKLDIDCHNKGKTEDGLNIMECKTVKKKFYEFSGTEVKFKLKVSIGDAKDKVIEREINSPILVTTYRDYLITLNDEGLGSENNLEVQAGNFYLLSNYNDDFGTSRIPLSYYAKELYGKELATPSPGEILEHFVNELNGKGIFIPSSKDLYVFFTNNKVVEDRGGYFLPEVPNVLVVSSLKDTIFAHEAGHALEGYGDEYLEIAYRLSARKNPYPMCCFDYWNCDFLGGWLADNAAKCLKKGLHPVLFRGYNFTLPKMRCCISEETYKEYYNCWDEEKGYYNIQCAGMPLYENPDLKMPLRSIMGYYVNELYYTVIYPTCDLRSCPP